MGTFPKSLHPSSRRMPGPITTGARGEERRLARVPEQDEITRVWVPAFAGTTK